MFTVNITNNRTVEVKFRHFQAEVNNWKKGNKETALVPATACVLTVFDGDKKEIEYLVQEVKKYSKDPDSRIVANYWAFKKVMNAINKYFKSFSRMDRALLWRAYERNCKTPYVKNYSPYSEMYEDLPTRKFSLWDRIRVAWKIVF